MKPEPTLLGWTWHAHFAELHRHVVDERWLDAAKHLNMMLTHALEKAAEQQAPRAHEPAKEDLCDCELRNRLWNGYGRCLRCGRKYIDRRPPSVEQKREEEPR